MEWCPLRAKQANNVWGVLNSLKRSVKLKRTISTAQSAYLHWSVTFYHLFKKADGDIEEEKRKNSLAVVAGKGCGARAAAADPCYTWSEHSSFWWLLSRLFFSPTARDFGHTKAQRMCLLFTNSPPSICCENGRLATLLSQYIPRISQLLSYLPHSWWR